MWLQTTGNVYTHVVGVDIVRTGPDDFYVLEDNARVPSGVSYMIENRATIADVSELFASYRIHAVSDYPGNCSDRLPTAQFIWII